MKLKVLHEDSPLKHLVDVSLEWLYNNLEEHGHKPDGMCKFGNSGAIVFVLERDKSRQPTRMLRIGVVAEDLPMFKYFYDIKESNGGHTTQDNGQLNMDPTISRKIITLINKYR